MLQQRFSCTKRLQFSTMSTIWTLFAYALYGAVLFITDHSQVKMRFHNALATLQAASHHLYRNFIVLLFVLKKVAMPVPQRHWKLLALASWAKHGQSNAGARTSKQAGQGAPCVTPHGWWRFRAFECSTEPEEADGPCKALQVWKEWEGPWWKGERNLCTTEMS